MPLELWQDSLLLTPQPQGETSQFNTDLPIRSMMKAPFFAEPTWVSGKINQQDLTPRTPAESAHTSVLSCGWKTAKR